MSKQKKEDEFFSQLAKGTGGRLLAGAGASKYFIDTGNYALNYICSGKFTGGGLPTGVSEIYGPPASSKSLLGYTCLGNVQKMGGVAILFDCERAANEKFAVSAGHVNEKQLILQIPEPNTIEVVQRKIIAAVKFIRKERGKDIPILFVWDSISASMCNRELQNLSIPLNPTEKDLKGTKEQPGERAKAASTMMRQINPFLDDHNASMLVLNQIRAKIGAYGPNPETTGGGGNALLFYANCRIRTSANKQIEDAKKKVPMGVNVSFKNKKSRSFVPFLSTSGVQLYFDRGINPLGGLLSVLIGAGRVELVGKATYQVIEPWAGGKEIKFKASMSRNDVPADVLYGCPAVVDAESEEQVRNYLGIFAQAIDLAVSDGTAESDMEQDDINDDDGVAAQAAEETSEE